MFFSIENKLADKPFMKAKIFANAKTIILNHIIRVDEVKLNDFLKKEFNLTLISACMYLLFNCKIQQDKDNNIIVLFNNKKLDTLATLITYGNLEIKGSTLLKEAFMQTVK